MERIIAEYTPANSRNLVYKGTFIVGDTINIGDEILVFHTCRTCKANILIKVIDKIVAYYFNDIPQYDYIVEGGSSYKCDTKHISQYDKIIRECTMK